MKQFMQRIWQNQLTGATILVFWVIVGLFFSFLFALSCAFLYDIQTGLFCRISTLLLPPYPTMITATLSPLRSHPSLIMKTATSDGTFIVFQALF